MMYYADATDATLQVSIELSELHSALLNLPVVRAKLYDYQATSEARVKLFREVFSGKTLNKVTMSSPNTPLATCAAAATWRPSSG